MDEAPLDKALPDEALLWQVIGQQKAWLDGHPDTDPTLAVPLRFLRPNTRYVANIYGDAPTTNLETNPDQVAITRIIVTRTDTLRAPMTNSGGQAVHLRPATARDVTTLPHCGRSTPLCTSHHR